LRFGVIQNAVCEEPSDFLFWDGVHPTAAGHRIVARAVRASAFANKED
jgi:phospholipase/lecithinase/hemolysin